ncbi:hypothetical protein AWB67_05674 [Caballeronia terrestris]|jgi:hypothetical protein|uniref:Uncharacterized protein n=1 Tax=Caballeronia terrestris TaxID=1226301 RepID=A0A158KJG8_9BURK|nr:hypothetical protein [Caballeronia terrestris]SAL80700.1 hypothetical protein AWB67_05674 [Caballeronia terrestris]
MTQKHKPSSIILSYVPDSQRLLIHVVETRKASALTAEVLEAPLLLEESDFKLDDEFARQLGVSLSNVLALSSPELKTYMSVTQAPIQREK